MIDNCCKLLQLHVFFLLDDNGARAASFSSSSFFSCFFNFTQLSLFCFNKELVTLKIDTSLDLHFLTKHT